MSQRQPFDPSRIRVPPSERVSAAGPPGTLTPRAVNELVRGAIVRHIPATLHVLGEIGDLRAVDPLIEALGDDEGHVRARAAQALGKLGDARAVGPLTGLLYDENGIVRVAVANALHELGAGLDE